MDASKLSKNTQQIKLSSSLSARLRAKMAIQGLTLAQVAQLTGRTVTQISRYRNGHTLIPLDVLHKLVDANILTKEDVFPSTGSGDAA